MRLTIVCLFILSFSGCATSFKDQCLENHNIYMEENNLQACLYTGTMSYQEVNHSTKH